MTFNKCCWSKRWNSRSLLGGQGARLLGSSQPRPLPPSPSSLQLRDMMTEGLHRAIHRCIRCRHAAPLCRHGRPPAARPPARPEVGEQEGCVLVTEAVRRHARQRRCLRHEGSGKRKAKAVPWPRRRRKSQGRGGAFTTKARRQREDTQGKGGVAPRRAASHRPHLRASARRGTPLEKEAPGAPS